VSYHLVLTEPKDERTKDVGENVFLDDLSYSYKVYLFYYPSALPNEALEDRLRRIGQMTGKNLFVNIGRLDDPHYDTIKEKFKIKNLPVIIITGIDGLASLADENNPSTVYVKIDRKELLGSIDMATQCVERIFNLFIGGEISKALDQAKSDLRDAVILKVKNKVIGALSEVKKFLDEKDIEVSLFEGKFQIKNSATSKV
jgi:hypothetical protein